jgi:hypothetical protein
MFKLKPSERITCWKQLRRDISLLPINEAAEKVEIFWQRCPFTPFYLDYKDPDSWPDPWELISENYYCDLAKCLGIIYTLHLTAHKDQLFPELRIYFDYISRHQYHIAYLCQGKYVLNLIEGQVVNKEHINQELKLIHLYTKMDLKLEQY